MGKIGPGTNWFDVLVAAVSGPADHEAVEIGNGKSDRAGSAQERMFEHCGLIFP